jgi:hypothetical protein
MNALIRTTASTPTPTTSSSSAATPSAIHKALREPAAAGAGSIANVGGMPTVGAAGCGRVSATVGPVAVGALRMARSAAWAERVFNWSLTSAPVSDTIIDTMTTVLNDDL